MSKSVPYLNHYSLPNYHKIPVLRYTVRLLSGDLSGSMKQSGRFLKFLNHDTYTAKERGLQCSALPGVLPLPALGDGQSSGEHEGRGRARTPPSAPPPSAPPASRTARPRKLRRDVARQKEPPGNRRPEGAFDFEGSDS